MADKDATNRVDPTSQNQAVVRFFYSSEEFPYRGIAYFCGSFIAQSNTLVLHLRTSYFLLTVSPLSLGDILYRRKRFLPAIKLLVMIQIRLPYLTLNCIEN